MNVAVYRKIDSPSAPGQMELVDLVSGVRQYGTAVYGYTRGNHLNYNLKFERQGKASIPGNRKAMIYRGGGYMFAFVKATPDERLQFIRQTEERLSEIG